MAADPFFIRLSSSRLSMRMSQVIGLPNSAKTESGIRIRCRSINRVSLKISSMRKEEQWLRFGASSICGLPEVNGAWPKDAPNNILRPFTYEEIRDSSAIELQQWPADRTRKDQECSR